MRKVNIICPICSASLLVDERKIKTICKNCGGIIELSKVAPGGNLSEHDSGSPMGESFVSKIIRYSGGRVASIIISLTVVLVFILGAVGAASVERKPRNTNRSRRTETTSQKEDDPTENTTSNTTTDTTTVATSNYSYTTIDVYGVPIEIPEYVRIEDLDIGPSYIIGDDEMAIVFQMESVNTASLSADMFSEVVDNSVSATEYERQELMVGDCQGIEYKVSYEGMLCKALYVNYSNLYGSKVLIFYFVYSSDDELVEYDRIVEQLGTYKAEDFDIAESTVQSSSSGTSQSYGQSSTTSSGVNPQLKQTLDSYEEFIDEYVAFMNTYSSADSADMYAMMDEYLDMLNQYTQFVNEIDNLDTSNMSTADYAYYLEVMARVSQKMLSVY